MRAGGLPVTGAGWYFSASHYDEVRQELHGHSYEVVVWWSGEPYRDAVVLQETLKDILTESFDHKTLPPELGTAEAIAKAIGMAFNGLISGCVRVDVSRPVERLYARWPS